MKNYLKFLFIVFGLSGFNSKTYSQVVINEYSCSNLTTITDNFGNTSDWVELYNAGGSAVNLTGYYLSNKISNPTKWTIPAGISIASHGYLLIWASGQNTVVGTNIHASFSLLQTKPQALVLSDPSAALLDSMTLKPTLPDHSRGRTVDGGATWGVLTSPTPNAANTGVKLDYAVRPVMSVAAGFYGGTQSVTITSPGTGVSIYYTTNGSTPTPLSTLYSGPVSISATTVLRARAFSTNPLVPASFIESNTYFIGVTHTTAVVSIWGDSILDLMSGTQFYPETGLEYFNVAKQLKAEADGRTNKHGNDSWAYNQRGIDYVCDDELGYNYALNEKFFVNKSRKSFARIILKAAANDNYPCEPGSAHIRDSYVETISQRGNLHLDERTWSPCVLYVNGQYWGVYDIREKVDDNDFTDYYYNQKDSLEYLMTWGATWSKYGGPQAQTDWNSLLAYISANSLANPAKYAHVDSILNVKSLADYIILNSWAVTSDWLNWNTGWWRGMSSLGQEKKWRYTLWDNDATFGHYINYTGIPSQLPTADPCAPESLGDPGGEGHVVILDSLLKSPIFKAYYESRYIDLLNTTLSCDYAVPLLDSMISMIAPEMPGQVARWGGSVSQWMANVDTMRSFINQRCTDIQAGMISCYGLTGPYNITYDVQPPASGNIKINTITPSSYIFSGSYYGNIATTLKATPNGSYVFDHWEMTHHTPAPSTVADSVTVTYNQSDNVIAVFRLTTEPQGGQEVGIASAFSPNGDNNNDVLYVLGSITDLNFTIYNRWGQEVFKTTDRSKGWDGTFMGQPCNPGVFAYR
ncbi:MAG: CotH kinase family protein, partial [Bacteroidia bacterium]